MNPLLKAMHELGGSGTIEEIVADLTESDRRISGYLTVCAASP